MASDLQHGEEVASGASHPYRPGDAMPRLDAEIERCLSWRRHQRRRALGMTLAVAIAALGTYVAITRVHWAGWALLGAIGLLVVPVMLFALVLGRRDSQFDERLRRDPALLAWLHVEIEPAREGMCASEMQLRDGTHTVFSLPADIATHLVERASQLPFSVTRNREARVAYLTDLQLRRIEDLLRRPQSSLASELAPFLLPTIEDRSCAVLPADRAASLKAALDELDRLLGAAARVDASRARRGVSPQVAALLDSGPPYSEKATGLARAIQAVFSLQADIASPDRAPGERRDRGRTRPCETPWGAVRQAR